MAHRRLGLVAAAAAMLAGASPACAEWLQATSRHFVLYANTSEGNLRRQSIALERADWTMRHVMKADDPPEAASNKVTVFMTSAADIRALCRCDNVGGFYVPRASGPVAFSGRDVWMGPDAGDASQLILFHEYAHHFLLGTYALTFPIWYSEGFAEFASTMRLKADTVTVGIAAQHRAYGLFQAGRLSAEQMFDPALWPTLKGDRFDAFYGRGWLMTHYLMFNPARYAQFRKYVALLNTGTPSVSAAREAFGDLKQLDRDLASYLTKSTIPGLTISLAQMSPPEVTIAPVGAGAAALMRLRMDSVRGVDNTTAKPLYAKAAAIAAKYPDDAVAQGWFAEMAFDAGEDAAAETAADRAVAHDAKSIQGLLYKARLRLRAVSNDPKADTAAWTAARRTIIAANRLDPDDAEPLWLFWQSFGMAGMEPSKSAKIGLYRAQELVPQDPQVRFAAATSRAQANETDEAKRLLRPLVYDPHGIPNSPPSVMLAALDAGKSGPAAVAEAKAAADQPLPGS